MTIRETMLGLLDLKLPENGQEGTADPIFIVYDRYIEIPEKAQYELEDDDRVVFEDGYWCFQKNGEIVPDEWFVEEGYAVWQQRFYGAYITREEAEEAIRQRRYALKNPYVYCESMYRSSEVLKQLIRLYFKATEPGVIVSERCKKGGL